jgi:addiction module HigA family antidote
MNETQGIRLKRPAHPGEFIRHEVFDPHGLSVTEAAKALGVTRPALSALLNGRAALSPEMAMRTEQAFGISKDTLMRMQASFDFARPRDRAADINVLRFKATKEKNEATLRK